MIVRSYVGGEVAEHVVENVSRGGAAVALRSIACSEEGVSAELRVFGTKGGERVILAASLAGETVRLEIHC